MTDTPKITLYVYATSPFAYKVYYFLVYKKLDFELVYVNPMGHKEIKFSGQHQVPVLKINDQFKNDSTPIGLWLEEKYPIPPIIPKNENDKQKILEIDQWISQSLIFGNFRALINDNFKKWISNGKVSANLLHHTRGLNWVLRKLWPILLKNTGFIQNIIKSLNLDETIPEMQKRHCEEFIGLLGKGPYLGEQEQPTIADLSAYPQFVIPYSTGMKDTDYFLEYPEIMNWIKKLEPQLKSDRKLIPENCVVNKI